MKILFLEMGMSKASPLLSLGDAVEHVGASVDFSDFSRCSTKELIHKYRECDVAVLVHYGAMSHYYMRQLALASLVGVPVIRYWAGTDALNVISRPEVCSDALILNRLLSKNVTCSHRGLIDELNSVKIQCDKIIKQVNKLEVSKDVEFVSASVLAYLPSNRRDFYGAKYIENLIKKYEGVNFSIVGDDDHYFGKYSNAKSYGWISPEEMEKVWGEVGLVIRITEHDGTPRMMYEALARGKYFIHNNKRLENIWFAESMEEIEEQFCRYLKTAQANHDGITFVSEYLLSKPEKQLFHYLSKVKLSRRAWWNSLGFVLKSFFQTYILKRSI